MNRPEIINGLVSILTPAYNASSHISYLLESILIQDYSKIEVIVINDGSNDDTEIVVRSYIDSFKKRGYSLSLINQENKGQSYAIKNGLNFIKGEFLVWPDSDDYYSTTNAISTMVGAFHCHGQNIGMVRVREALIKRNNATDNIIGIYGQHLSGITFSRDIFRESLLGSNGFYYTPGGFMIKTQYLFESLKSFYVDKLAGQNAQLLFPVLYHYDCYTIPQVHYHVLVRPDSHSRRITKSFKQSIRQYDVYERTCKETLFNIDGILPDDLSTYLNLNQINHSFNCLLLSFLYNNRLYAKYYFRRLRRSKAHIPVDVYIRYILFQCGALELFRKFRKVLTKTLIVIRR